MATIDEMSAALRFFFEKTCDKDFVKSKLSSLQTDGEQPLLGYLGCFLLGWFGEKSSREEWVEHMLKPTGTGRVDFLIGTTALEVAVRAKDDAVDKLLETANKDEVAKLLRYRDGKAVLALFDYSDKPLDKIRLDEAYRRFNPLHGNAIIAPYTVLYFSPKITEPYRLEIRISGL